MIAALLVVWIGVMAALALVAAWFILARFPDVFFQVSDWRKSGKAKRIRKVLFAGVSLFAVAALIGLVRFFLRRA